MIRVATRRGTVELAARQDDAIPTAWCSSPSPCRGGRQSPHQSGARSVRQDFGIQVLRGTGRGDRAGDESRGGVSAAREGGADCDGRRRPVR